MLKKYFFLVFSVVALWTRSGSATLERFYGAQQTWHFDTLANAAAYVGLHPGYQVIVDSNGTGPARYTVWPPSTFSCSSPHCANGISFQLADDYTINNSFVTTIAWANVTGKPTTLGGYGITDAVAQTIQLIVSGGGMTVNGGSSTTLAGNVTFALGQIPWSTGISGFPTITATLPLGITGTFPASINVAIAAATTSAAGSMSSTDKTKLDAVPTPSTIVTGSGTSSIFPIFTGSTAIGNSILSQPSGYAISDSVTSNLGNSWTAPGGFRHFTLGSCYPDGTNFQCLASGTNAIEMLTSKTDGFYFSTANSIGATNRTATSADLDTLTRMTVKDDGVRAFGKLIATGEVQSTSANTFRAVSGNYGFFTRNDGTSTSFQLTNSGDQYGGGNSLLPFVVDNAGGNVGIGSTPGSQKLKVNGSVLAMGEVATQNINSYRIVNGNYGEFWRSNADDLYLLITNSGDQYGSYNGLRPLTVHAASGNVGIGNYPDPSSALSVPTIQITSNAGAGKLLVDPDGTGRGTWDTLANRGILTRTDANTTTSTKTNVWYSGPYRIWDSEYEFLVATPTAGTPNGIACGDWISCSATYPDYTSGVTTSTMVRVEVESSNADYACRQVFYASLMWAGGAWVIPGPATENASERIFCGGGLTTASVSAGGSRSIVVTLANPGPYAMIKLRVRLFGSGHEV